MVNDGDVSDGHLEVMGGLNRQKDQGVFEGRQVLEASKK